MPLSTDTSLKTLLGASFTAPSGWSAVSTNNMWVFTAPEADACLALVDTQDAFAADAVARAWREYRPDANRPLRLAMPLTQRNGWDERYIYQYETSPNEAVVCHAVAHRLGNDWTIAITDASRTTFDKRSAAFQLILESLRARGYQRETFTGRKARELDNERIGLLKDFVRFAMQLFHIPGVGLSLIDSGDVVFEGGFGVRTLGAPEAVDAHTLFLCASNTKALTTLLLARLVDENNLRWEQPVTEVYPQFRLGDAETTRQVLIRHLVSASIGLPRQDLEFIFNFGAATPTSCLGSLAAMKPTSSFGEIYQYSNFLAAAGGYVAAFALDREKEIGAAYDGAMRTMLFEPLGMAETTFDFPRAMRGNFASPHGDDVDGNICRGSMDINYSIVPLRPAGGMWTSAHDLSKYLQMELSLGVLPDGCRLISAENVLERRKGRVQVSEGTRYGMGLMINTQYGIPIVHHGGSMFGYKSDMIFLPDHGVGAVVLTNSDSGSYLYGLFLRRLLEVLFNGNSEATKQAQVVAAQHAAFTAKRRERFRVPPDAAEVRELAPHYTSATLGSLRIRTDANTTIFDFSDWRSAVASRKNDDGTLSFFLIDPATFGTEFVVGERNGKRALLVRGGQHEYSFIEL
jgi:CubicO group peptidase (beta-lactamase class C family)